MPVGLCFLRLQLFQLFDILCDIKDVLLVRGCFLQTRDSSVGPLGVASLTLLPVAIFLPLTMVHDASTPCWNFLPLTAASLPSP